MAIAIKNVVPVVGMGASKRVGSDSHAGTIVAIKTNKRKEVVGFTFQKDTATRTDNNGQSDSQTYDYAPNPEGEKEEVTLRKNGRWVRVGDTQSGTGYVVGHRREFYDYSR